MPRARVPQQDGQQDGFTLVEVMVAITLLLVGVLGTVTMIDGANAITSKTKAREGATALARSVLEISRGVPYKDLTSARVLQELEARPGLDDAQPGVGGHQIESRNFTYTVTPTACTMDDPKDGLGEHDELDLTFCADSDALPVGAASEDRNPDDYRSVEIQLDWTVGAHAESVTQTGVITNPAGGLGPAVLSLDPDDPATTTISGSDTTTATYEVGTSAAAHAVSWSVRGAQQGDATGEGTQWGFSWGLGDVDAPTFYDCSYVLRAEAFDEEGRSGAPFARTITLNRRKPFPPPNFAGGRNLNGGASTAYVDLEWRSNQECDVKEYRVYRGTDLGAITTPVEDCTRTPSQPKECVDQTAPSGTALYYQVVAFDTPPEGGDREGDRSDVLVVGSEDDNDPPDAPENLSTCTGGNPGCTDIDGQDAPSGTAVLSWDPASDADGSIRFYRVYRDGDTYADRLDVLYPVAGKPLVFVDETASGSHTYRVSAVDDLYGESLLSDAVGWPTP